jgi:hypothetical protein
MNEQKITAERHTIAGDGILTEQIVGTFSDDVFFSLLFDRQNRTLRVFDFTVGHSAAKREYLDRTLIAEGVRKIFTVVERREVRDWKSIGYQSEGVIPDYFNRSDSHIMSCFYNDNHEIESILNENQNDLSFFREVETLAGKLSSKKPRSIQAEQVTEKEAFSAIEKQLKGQEKAQRGKAAKKESKTDRLDSSVFPKFGRRAECLYFSALNSRTEQVNVAGVEYQEYWRNAKIDILAPLLNQADARLARSCLLTAIESLREIGVVSVFALARGDAPFLNALYSSAGFNNTGRLQGHLLAEKGPIDQLLWTKKLASKPTMYRREQEW